MAKTRINELINYYDNPMYYFWVADILLNPDRTIQLQPEQDRYNTFMLQLFDEMEKKDTHIGHCLNKRKSYVINTDYELLTEGTGRKDKRILEFVQRQLFENIEIDKLMLAMLDAIAKGYSVIQMDLERINGYVELKSFLHIPPWFCGFNKQNRLVYFRDTLNDYDVLDERQFVVFSYNPMYNNRYGNSELSVGIFWLYFWKKEDWKLWIKFLEAYSSPIATAKYPNDLSEADQVRLLEVINNIRNSYVGILPEGSELELHQANAQSISKSYESFIERVNAEISKRLLGQTLTSETFDTGSLAQSKVHQRVLEHIVTNDCKQLQSAINDQVIRKLVDYNFDNVEYYPYFRFDLSEHIDLKERVEVYQGLQKMGLDIGEKHVRELFGVPEIEKDEQILKKRSEPKQNPFGESDNTEEDIQEEDQNA